MNFKYPTELMYRSRSSDVADRGFKTPAFQNLLAARTNVTFSELYVLCI